MGILRKDQVLGRIKDTSAVVSVPELGGDIRVVKPPAHLSVAFFAAVNPFADEKGNINIDESSATAMLTATMPLIRHCCRDDNNEKLFEGEQGERLLAELEPNSISNIIKAIPTSKKKESSRPRDRRKPTKTAAKRKRAKAKKKPVQSKSQNSRPSRRPSLTSQSDADTPTPTT